jgi:hypothetical protein
MHKTCLLRLVSLVFLALGARAQPVQNSDIFFMAGPTITKTQTIPGTNVTVYGSTGWGASTGYGYQVKRASALSLWVEIFPVVTATSSAERATIPGSVSITSTMFVPAARLMVPVQSRISVFGAVGGGYATFDNLTLTSDNPPDLKTRSVTHGVFSFGGGVDFRLHRFLSLRLSARDYVTGRDLGGVAGRNHFLPMFGVAFHF